MMGSEYGWVLGEGSNFQSDGLNIEFYSRRNSLTQAFVESCVDFEVAIYRWSWFGDRHTGDSYLSIHKHNSSIQLLHW